MADKLKERKVSQGKMDQYAATLRGYRAIKGLQKDLTDPIEIRLTQDQMRESTQRAYDTGRDRATILRCAIQDGLFNRNRSPTDLTEKEMMEMKIKIMDSLSTVFKEITGNTNFIEISRETDGWKIKSSTKKPD